MFVTATRWDSPDSIDREETSPEASGMSTHRWPTVGICIAV